MATFKSHSPTPHQEIIYWLVVNAGILAALYAGFGLDIEGARHLIRFFAWGFYLPVSLAALTEYVQEKAAATKPRPICSALGRLNEWAVLITLIWTNHLVTAGAWALAMFCGMIFRGGVADKRAAAIKKAS